jgi:arabinan endo-1,5-alpha-L-arabinosidase
MARLLSLIPLLLLASASGCSGQLQQGKPMDPSRYYSALPADDPTQGNMVPVHDPSITRRADGTYVVFDTDIPFLHNTEYIEERCSTDLLEWHGCGFVFSELPGWVQAQYPEAHLLWAPDISYFHGLWHLYYAASTLGSQHSGIGLATNVTLDPRDPRYAWQDQGVVLSSEPGSDFNAIDANILVEPAQGGKQARVWMSYGSFWKGLFQQEVDPATGRLVDGGKRWHLAEQPVRRHGALEGAAMLAHDGWYYLFASVGLCCDIPIERDTYQQIVGRSHNVHGPFVDQNGNKLLKGGGTVLLTGDAHWIGPGGGSAWQSGNGGETLFTFHALHRSQNGALDLWVERVRWTDGWPVLEPIR